MESSVSLGILLINICDPTTGTSNREKILQGKIIESEDGVTRARYFPTVLVRIKDNYGKEYLL